MFELLRKLKEQKISKREFFYNYMEYKVLSKVLPKATDLGFKLSLKLVNLRKKEVKLKKAIKDLDPKLVHKKEDKSSNVRFIDF